MNTNLDMEHPAPPTGIFKAMQRFNRDTTWVLLGLVTPVIIALVMVAPQERHLKVDDLAEEPRQTGGDLLLNANPTAPSDVVRSNQEGIGEITLGQATNVDSELTPEISDLAIPSNGISRSPAPQPDCAQLIRSKISNVRHRSSMRPRFLNVKMRLIALWHQRQIFKKNPAHGYYSRTRRNWKERKSATGLQRAIDAPRKRGRGSGPLLIAAAVQEAEQGN